VTSFRKKLSYCISATIQSGFRAGPEWSCSKAVNKLVWRIPLLSVQWINSWWWTDELSETCRVSLQNKFVRLVHLVGFITKRKVLRILRKFLLNILLSIILRCLEW